MARVAPRSFPLVSRVHRLQGVCVVNGRRVMRLGDDNPVPIIGTVLRELDDERLLVRWDGGAPAGRVEFHDELQPVARCPR